MSTRDSMHAHAARSPTKGPLRKPAGGLLAGMRVRKKLLFLHTCFSLALAAVLLVAVRPAIDRLVSQAERAKAVTLVATLAGQDSVRSFPIDGVTEVSQGDAVELGLTQAEFDAIESSGGPVPLASDTTGRVRVAQASADGTILVVSTAMPEVRTATAPVYLLLVVAVIVVYALIVAALEVYVLPQNVYAPIGRMLRADRAVQEGDAERELIPADEIPADELGEIMRSRNASIIAMREQERELARALDRIETVAADLKRKNYLLETARRNLEGADRLASLGMMSAGIAHELNTPLSVAKGLVEKLADAPASGLPEHEARLLARVVGRLERLGESLLDFARARETVARPAGVSGLVDEAITLVRLDRETGPMLLENSIPRDLIAEVDADRMIQVFVNLIRNAVDAVRRGGADSPERGVAVSAEGVERDGVGWICVRVSDDGRGIDPEMLPTLFEPFVSDTLDARGTGLGLAVAEGIVREHGGTLIARNRAHRRGAVFEIMMPRCRPESRPEGRGEAPTVTGPGADTSDTDSGEPARMESPE